MNYYRVDPQVSLIVIRWQIERAYVGCDISDCVATHQIRHHNIIALFRELVTNVLETSLQKTIMYDSSARDTTMLLGQNIKRTHFPTKHFREDQDCFFCV